MAEKMLSEKLGEVEYDGLIAGVNPKKRVGPGVIAGPEAETTFVRGTVFAKSAKDGKLHILGTEASGGDTLTADCILIEDVTMKASMDETVAVYHRRRDSPAAHPVRRRCVYGYAKLRRFHAERVQRGRNL